MKYFNIIMLSLGLIVNIVLYVASPNNIGIGISKSGEISAVGNLNKKGEKNGYWLYLDSCDSKKIATIIGHYTENKADSLWVQFYGDAYPAVYTSYYMANDSACGFRYIYNTKGHLERMYYVWPNQVKYEWNYYNDIKTDSNFWAPYMPLMGGNGKLFFEELEIQNISTSYADVVLFDIALMSLLLIINILKRKRI